MSCKDKSDIEPTSKIMLGVTKQWVKKTLKV